jgi:hypothetical protein
MSDALPKCTITDYQFLTTKKQQSLFYLKNQRAAREHVRRKWGEKDWQIDPVETFEVIRFYSNVVGIQKYP